MTEKPEIPYVAIPPFLTPCVPRVPRNAAQQIVELRRRATHEVGVDTGAGLIDHYKEQDAIMRKDLADAYTLIERISDPIAQTPEENRLIDHLRRQYTTKHNRA